MRALIVVVFAALLGGCTAEEGAFAFQRGEVALDPYFKEYREVVAGSHSKLFEVPVEAQASVVNVTVQLDARTNGLPVPDATPARLRVQLVDPSGATLREAELDARTPAASLVLEDAPPGLYQVRIDGFGASQDLEGETYGSGYVVMVEVAYG